MEASQHYGVVSGPPWPEAVLIGGGPSASVFQFDRLRRRITVAINDAAVRLPWATALFSEDSTWIKNRQSQIKAFHGSRYLVVDSESDCKLPDVTYLRPCNEPGLSQDPATINVGGTSGFGALNLAYLKGARRIFLVGFDYLPSTTHWFPNYKWAPVPVGDLFPLWAQKFNAAVKQLQAAGVTVFNVGLTSSITAFDKVSYQQFQKFLEATDL